MAVLRADFSQGTPSFGTDLGPDTLRAAWVKMASVVDDQVNARAEAAGVVISLGV